MCWTGTGRVTVRLVVDVLLYNVLCVVQEKNISGKCWLWIFCSIMCFVKCRKINNIV